jgi:hypothetical protein
MTDPAMLTAARGIGPEENKLERLNWTDLFFATPALSLGDLGGRRVLGQTEHLLWGSQAPWPRLVRAVDNAHGHAHSR